jgi:kynurenine formamidase
LKYSNTNPPYLEEDAARFIRESGIKHSIDLPSVDKENDEVVAHKAFWNVTDVNNLNADARWTVRLRR